MNKLTVSNLKSSQWRAACESIFLGMKANPPFLGWSLGQSDWTNLTGTWSLYPGQKIDSLEQMILL